MFVQLQYIIFTYLGRNIHVLVSQIFTHAHKHCHTMEIVVAVLFGLSFQLEWQCFVVIERKVVALYTLFDFKNEKNILKSNIFESYLSVCLVLSIPMASSSTNTESTSSGIGKRSRSLNELVSLVASSEKEQTARDIYEKMFAEIGKFVGQVTVVEMALE